MNSWTHDIHSTIAVLVWPCHGHTSFLGASTFLHCHSQKAHKTKQSEMCLLPVVGWSISWVSHFLQQVQSCQVPFLASSWFESPNYCMESMHLKLCRTGFFFLPHRKHCCDYIVRHCWSPSLLRLESWKLQQNEFSEINTIQGPVIIVSHVIVHTYIQLMWLWSLYNKVPVKIHHSVSFSGFSVGFCINENCYQL